MKLFSILERLAANRKGQDMIEYALLAAAFAVVIGAIFPPSIMPGVSTIFSKVVSSFNAS